MKGYIGAGLAAVFFCMIIFGFYYAGVKKGDANLNACKVLALRCDSVAEEQQDQINECLELVATLENRFRF